MRLFRSKLYSSSFYEFPWKRAGGWGGGERGVGSGEFLPLPFRQGVTFNTDFWKGCREEVPAPFSHAPAGTGCLSPRSTSPLASPSPSLSQGWKSGDSSFPPTPGCARSAGGSGRRRGAPLTAASGRSAPRRPPAFRAPSFPPRPRPDRAAPGTAAEVPRRRGERQLRKLRVGTACYRRYRGGGGG